ncbi:TPA: ribonuclease H-like domain-containing protein [Candidatus Woesearchaeota archaeon]|nr:ribonuclease H-like domain-containing protein [Candidatus Woesearchaeota archaeon]
MLQESFLFLPGVQERTERRFWELGINTWDDLLAATHIPGISKERLIFWKGRIRLARHILDSEDGTRSMGRMLGTRNSWRLYRQLLENPRFLDIETTEYCNQVTVVGISDGEFYQAFVRGRNLDIARLRRALAGATCIITFNGSSFDLPIIDRNFPGVLPDVPHIDLRHVCAQANLRGGLKAIERHLSIRRADNIRETDGTDAIMLWYRHALGDEHALQSLIDYNAADVLNLKPLADMVIPALWNHVRHEKPLPFLPSAPRSIFS